MLGSTCMPLLFLIFCIPYLSLIFAGLKFYFVTVLSNITVKHHLVKLKLAAFTLGISLWYQRPVNGNFHTIYSVVPLNWIFSASFKKSKYLQYLPLCFFGTHFVQIKVLHKILITLMSKSNYFIIKSTLPQGCCYVLMPSNVKMIHEREKQDINI